ncbi:MAG: hypothetical protein DWQ10_07600 [Calditrichaeota bacterium]|nr:MAG: hypothetical protein DWQ10_07600 [Calditrichota bacterium]
MEVTDMSFLGKEFITTNRTSKQSDIPNRITGNSNTIPTTFDDELNKKLTPEDKPDMSYLETGWRGSMPAGDPAIEVFNKDIQLKTAWRIYSFGVHTREEKLTPSEFLKIMNSVTPEQITNSDAKVTEAQKKGIKHHYGIQPPPSSLYGLSPERQIELYNKMFAAGLLEHNPTVDVNIGRGHLCAQYGPEGFDGMPLMWQGVERVPLSEYQYREHLIKYIMGPQELLARLKESLVGLDDLNLNTSTDENFYSNRVKEIERQNHEVYMGLLKS